MTEGRALDPAGATGRSNEGKWSGLTRRVSYRAAVAAADTLSDLTDDVKVPPIDLKPSRLAYDNQLIAFLRLLTGATSVTVQLWTNVLDVVAGVTPAGDATDWAFIEEVTVTKNQVVKFAGEAGGTGIIAGTHKILVTAIAGGGGTVDIHHQHSNIVNV